MKAGRWILGAVLVTGAGVAGWYYLGKGNHEDTYQTTPARRGSISANIAATGKRNSTQVFIKDCPKRVILPPIIFAQCDTLPPGFR